MSLHKRDADARTMTRSVWKWWYRQQRIADREANKAFVDAMISGVGYIRFSEAGFVNHILPGAIHAGRETEIRIENAPRR